MKTDLSKQKSKNLSSLFTNLTWAEQLTVSGGILSSLSMPSSIAPSRASSGAFHFSNVNEKIAGDRNGVGVTVADLFNYLLEHTFV